MEEINKVAPSTGTKPAIASKPTSESTENSLDFQLISKKDKKYTWVWVLLGVLIFALITVGLLIYLKIIDPSSLF
jgi:hypothetical protein